MPARTRDASRIRAAVWMIALLVWTASVAGQQRATRGQWHDYGGDPGSAEYTGNAGVWAPIAVDEEFGYAYLPVEAVTSDYYEGHRPGANLFSSTLLFIDVRTGRRVWHQQLVHHDIWDYDIASALILVDLRVDGSPMKAVVQLTKQAFAFVFDRVTGRPFWPVEARPVPQTAVPGEWTVATQPFPTRPPPFDRQGITDQELIDFTPELQHMARRAIEPYRIGPFFGPPSLAVAPDGTEGPIGLPGNLGGAGGPEGDDPPRCSARMTSSPATSSGKRRFRQAGWPVRP